MIYLLDKLRQEICTLMEILLAFSLYQIKIQTAFTLKYTASNN